MDVLKGRKIIVIGMEHYNPLGLVRTLGRSGVKPDYIAIKHKSEVVSKSKFVNYVHHVDDIEDAYRVLLSEYAGRYDDPPVVITTDDDIQSLLDLHYDELKDAFVMFNSGVSGRTTEFMNKKTILDIAQKHGLKVLDTWVVVNGEIPDDIRYPIITKAISPNDGGWKSDVHICNSETELVKAFETIRSPKILLQRYVHKNNEVCVDGFTIDHGKTMFNMMCTTYNYNIDGYYSPYMTIHPYFLDEVTTEGLAGMLEEIGFEGIYSIEFLVDSDDTLYFSEVNFRNSTWNYCITQLGMPLPYLWVKAMLTGEVCEEWIKPIPEGFVAMVEPIDHKKRVIEGDTDLADWLSDFRNADCLFYQDDEDPEPFREMVRNWERLS